MLKPEQIRKARTRAGYTQDELADAVGVGVKTVNNWEAGRTSVKRYIGKLEAVLGPYLDADAPAPLAMVSDAQLLAEIARRFERGRAEEGKDDDGTPIDAPPRKPRTAKARTPRASSAPGSRPPGRPAPGPR